MYKVSLFLIITMVFSASVFAKNTSVSVSNTKKNASKITTAKDLTKNLITEGQEPHPFTLMSIKRRFKSLKKIISLNKDKDIFLIFFTTSCKSCVKERAKIIKMTETNPKILPILIGVRNPKDETILEFNSNIKRIIKEENIKIDIYLDLYSTVAKFYNVKEGTSISVPKLFIVNSNSGKIVKIISGYDEKLPEIYKKLYKKN